MVEIGRRFGLRAARVPLEPRHVLRKIEPQTPHASAWLTAPFALLLRRRFRAAGLMAPDSVFGLQWSGQMTKGRLSGLIRNLPDGLSEIYLHPATGPFAGAAHAIIAIGKSSTLSWLPKSSRRPAIPRCGLADSAISWGPRRLYTRAHLTERCPTGV